jgi:Spy/CpxP family protein refolding chaperone
MNTRKMVIVGMVLTMVLAGTMSAMAGGFRKGHGEHGMGHMLGGLKMFLELNLSESQQTDMSAVINKYDADVEGAREALKSAKMYFGSVIHADTFEESQIRSSFQELSAAKENMIVLNARIMSELKALLTADQLALLERKKAEKMKKRKALESLIETQE